MELNTRLFGRISYEPEDVIAFPGGIPSFEEEHEFLLLPVEGSDGVLFGLQSVATPTLSFMLMNPFALDPSYAPLLREGERRLLQVQSDQELCFYVLCAMKRPLSSSTVNMKSPIALNPDQRIATQVILDTEQYHMRHPLSEFTPQRKEEAPC